MSQKIKFVLHIGANKTGTSSIQNMLARNPAALAEAGWVYPDFHLLHQAHHKLAYAISGRNDQGMPEDWQAAFAALTADPDKRFIFSSELFFRSVPPAKVAQLFPPEQTHVILYLRDHVSYMASWYAQAIQERNLIAGFTEYVQAFAQPLSGYVKAWDDVYGADRITLRSFQRNALYMRDSRMDFIMCVDALGQDGHIGNSLTLPTEVSNLSISGNLLFFKRILNNYMSLEEASDAPIPDEFGAFAAVKDSFNGRFSISADDIKLINKLFHDDVEALQARGLRLGPLPKEVEGHMVPDPATLRDDVQLIKRIAIESDKHFMKYASRWLDWHNL